MGAFSESGSVLDIYPVLWEFMRPGTSPVDWCEDNYNISANIAEFVNTFSNFLFILLPPVLIMLFKEYGRFVTPGIHLLWVLLIVVGLSSMYFHATLSLIGQLLDELAILWVFMAAYSLFFPRRYYPKFIRNDRKAFGWLMLFSAILATALSLWKPIVNAFVLMGMGVPTMVMLYRELQRVGDRRVYRLGLRTTTVWAIAVFCWINDRMFCETWSAINFPYLHGFWHVLIFIASYTVLVLYAYFYVESELPQRRPLLKYWPVNEFEFGIPFISIRNPDSKDWHKYNSLYFCKGQDFSDYAQSKAYA
ncbi:alkaline ceramidase [Scaptodrosophila lebanonensis]|uniref:Alkaline ceramidase n=1 Tax=Drosophila lebanonensis TaxID=7225 RepID=A0A6J2TPX5_DROLE|nr:alkaline ceramidase [Scaptodrosophila lebanonensis]